MRLVAGQRRGLPPPARGCRQERRELVHAGTGNAA
jgi:hypothetical protein